MGRELLGPLADEQAEEDRLRLIVRTCVIYPVLGVGFVGTLCLGLTRLADVIR